MKNILPLIGLALAGACLAVPAFANGVIHPGGFPTPIGPIANEITGLYNIIFVIIAVIFVIVTVPITYILWRYRRTKVAKPATFSHHMGFEILWTVIPALICIFIALASYKAMLNIRTMPKDALNVEVVAYQFGWDFYYPDYSSNGVHVAAPEPTQNDPEVSLPGLPRQTKTLVVPINRPVVLHVTSQDVIHAFWMPHLGVKIDAIPGRINYAWFEATQPGDWLGQCAELCGQAHAEMFFRVKAVTPQEFESFIEKQRVAAGLPGPMVSETAVVSGTEAVSETAAVGVQGAGISGSTAAISAAASGTAPVAP